MGNSYLAWSTLQTLMGQSSLKIEEEENLSLRAQTTLSSHPCVSQNKPLEEGENLLLRAQKAANCYQYPSQYEHFPME